MSVTRDRVLSAVLEPRRRAILRLLAEQEMPVGRLAAKFDVSRPAVSQHLAVLRGAGLVEVRSEKGSAGYRIRPEGIAAARAALAAVAAELPGAGEEDRVRAREAAEAASEAGAAQADPQAQGASPVPEARAPQAARPAAAAPVDADAVVLEVTLAAAPDRVLEHLTDQDLITRWMGERAELDPRPGGLFRVALGGGDVAAGAYVEVAPPRRVVFTWGAEGAAALLAPGTSRVEVDLAPVPGGSRLRLAHRDLPPVARAPHLATWARHLARLARVLAS